MVSIKLGFSQLESLMGTITSVVNDKLLQEDLKNLIIWKKGDVLRFVGYNGNIVTALDVDAISVDGIEEEEYFTQLKAKDINDVLGTFKSLNRTVVSGVELIINDNEAQIVITESAANESLENADIYNRKSKFRVTKPRLKEMVKNEIQKVDLDVVGVSVQSVDLLLYINSLLPTVEKETRDSTNNILFGEEKVYTVLASHTAIMPNRLNKEISDFRIPNSVVKFVKGYISNTETFEFHKNVLGNGAVVLTLKKDGAIATIKCADMSRAFDITNFLEIPTNGIAVDKLYLIDVLKRVNLGSESPCIEVKVIKDEVTGATVGEMRVQSKAMTQSIPVTKAKGEGEFSFSMKADLLSSMIFAHTTDFDESVFFYFDKGDRGNIVMVCKDNSNFWHTKMVGVTPAKGDFAW